MANTNEDQLRTLWSKIEAIIAQPNGDTMLPSITDLAAEMLEFDYSLPEEIRHRVNAFMALALTLREINKEAGTIRMQEAVRLVDVDLRAVTPAQYFSQHVQSQLDAAKMIIDPWGMEDEVERLTKAEANKKTEAAAHTTAEAEVAE